MTAVGFVGAHALVLLALAATAYVAGRLALRLVARVGEGQAERRGGSRSQLMATASASEATALGLVVLATLGCLLGFAGALAAAPLLVCVAAIHLAGLAEWRKGWRRGTSWAIESWRACPRSRRIGWTAAGAVTFVPLFALSLYAPTAFDETLYHLPFARAFAATGGLPFLPDLRFPVFPQLAEVLYAEMLLVSGDVATHFVSLLAVGLTAGLLVGWGREWTAGTGGAAVGWIAAAVWLGNPIVVYLAGTCYVEPLLALFVTAALRAFWRWRHGDGGEWLALAAVFAGAAASTKYLGLYFVMALALAALALPPPVRASAPRGAGARQPAATAPGLVMRLRALGVFVAVAILAMAPWFGRILKFTGNPVFPYLSGIFGANAWTPVRFYTLVPSHLALDGESVVRYVLRLLTLPWDVVARRELVGGLPPFSPVYLLGVPLLAWIVVHDRRSRGLLALVGGFLVLFPLLPADARYVVTVLPTLSLALAVAAATILDRITARSRPGWRPARTRALGLGLAAALVLPGVLYAGYHLVRQGPLPTTAAARKAYLRRSVPLYAAVVQLTGRVHPGDTVYGLFAERMRDYVPARFLSDWYGPHRYANVIGVLSRPEALATTLRGWSVDFLLVERRTAAGESFVEPDARAGFELIYADDDALLYALRPPTGGRPAAQPQSAGTTATTAGGQ